LIAVVDAVACHSSTPLSSSGGLGLFVRFPRCVQALCVLIDLLSLGLFSFSHSLPSGREVYSALTFSPSATSGGTLLSFTAIPSVPSVFLSNPSLSSFFLLSFSLPFQPDVIGHENRFPARHALLQSNLK